MHYCFKHDALCIYIYIYIYICISLKLLLLCQYFPHVAADGQAGRQAERQRTINKHTNTLTVTNQKLKKMYKTVTHGNPMPYVCA